MYELSKLKNEYIQDNHLLYKRPFILCRNAPYSVACSSRVRNRSRTRGSDILIFRYYRRIRVFALRAPLAADSKRAPAAASAATAFPANAAAEASAAQAATKPEAASPAAVPSAASKAPESAQRTQSFAAAAPTASSA